MKASLINRTPIVTDTRCVLISTHEIRTLFSVPDYKFFHITASTTAQWIMKAEWVTRYTYTYKCMYVMHTKEIVWK